MKSKKTTLNIKKQKHIKMNDEQKNEIGEIKSKDNRLKNFIERVERLEEKKYNILLDIKEDYSETKSSGHDPKIIRKILAIQRKDTDERLEQEALLDTNKNALGIF